MSFQKELSVVPPDRLHHQPVSFVVVMIFAIFDLNCFNAFHNICKGPKHYPIGYFFSFAIVNILSHCSFINDNFLSKKFQIHQPFVSDIKLSWYDFFMEGLDIFVFSNFKSFPKRFCVHWQKATFNTLPFLLKQWTLTI